MPTTRYITPDDLLPSGCIKDLISPSDLYISPPTVAKICDSNFDWAHSHITIAQGATLINAATEQSWDGPFTFPGND